MLINSNRNLAESVMLMKQRLIEEETTMIFFGVLSTSEIVGIIQGEYTVKAIVAFLDTIILYGVVKFLFKKTIK